MADQDSNLHKAIPDTVLSDWHNVWHMLSTWQGTANSDRDWAALSKVHQCATSLPSPMHCDVVKPLKGYSDHESVTREPTQATKNRL